MHCNSTFLERLMDLIIKFAVFNCFQVGPIVLAFTVHKEYRELDICMQTQEICSLKN
jgi:hypothetical protein